MQASLTDMTFDAWESTHVLPGNATRVMGTEEYLGRSAPEVGTRVGDHAFELFAICPPAEALQLQFEVHQPTFIAVHDLGSPLSARFVADLAAAMRLPLQTLTIRRQGVGITLATLQFIELPPRQGSQLAAPLRVYATTADADTATRHLVAEVLLAFSRLGVVLVGGIAPHALATQFAPLRERLLATPWHNRQLLFVPVAPTSPGLADQAHRLVAETPVAAAVTPLVADTARRWGFIQGAWNRLRNSPPEKRPETPPDPGAPLEYTPPSAPLPMRPMPAAGGRAGVLGEAQLSRYAQACSVLKGSLGCCVFELEEGSPVAYAGPAGQIDALAPQGARLVAAALDSGARLGVRGGAAECLVTLDRQLLFVRQLPQQRSLGMLAAFDRALANPMVVRVQLQRLEPLLDSA